MGDYAGIDETGTLRMQLDLRLDCQPISGSIRTERGAEERFVGWLGFAGAVERLRQRQHRSPVQAGDQTGAPRDAATTTERSSGR
jgi:hypothetical protein